MKYMNNYSILKIHLTDDELWEALFPVIQKYFRENSTLLENNFGRVFLAHFNILK